MQRPFIVTACKTSGQSSPQHRLELRATIPSTTTPSSIFTLTPDFRTAFQPVNTLKLEQGVRSTKGSVPLGSPWALGKRGLSLFLETWTYEHTPGLGWRGLGFADWGRLGGVVTEIPMCICPLASGIRGKWGGTENPACSKTGKRTDYVARFFEGGLSPWWVRLGVCPLGEFVLEGWLRHASVSCGW